MANQKPSVRGFVLEATERVNSCPDANGLPDWSIDPHPHSKIPPPLISAIAVFEFCLIRTPF
jgi:hypothetical protein